MYPNRLTKNRLLSGMFFESARDARLAGGICALGCIVVGREL